MENEVSNLQPLRRNKETLTNKLCSCWIFFLTILNSTIIKIMDIFQTNAIYIKLNINQINLLKRVNSVYHTIVT